MACFLGIDNGGTMSKAAIYDETGRELAVCSRKVEVLHPERGFNEVDMDALWSANVQAIRTVLEKSKIDPKTIRSIAVTGHGNGMYLVDSDGRSLLGIRSTDMRGREYVERWTEARTLDKIRCKTMQATWPAQPNALLRWLRDYQPDLASRVRWMFMIKDFVRFRLTGIAQLEMTDASATSLVNNLTGEYDPEILEAWGVSEFRDIFPPIVGSCEICGSVTPEAAEATGLAPGTPVAGGMFDIDAAGLAVGMKDETSLCLIAGTWGNNQYIAREPVVSEDIFMTTRYCIPGYYLMLEGSATSASNLEWWVSEFFPKTEVHTNENVYETVDRLVAETKPEDCDLIFLPYLYASPVDMDAKGTLYGLEGWQTRGHILRAVFEGIIFGHYWHIDRLLKFRTMPNPILLAGGGAKSEVWAQMYADIFQTVVKIPDAAELGTLGAAIAAAVAAGEYPDCASACARMVHFTRTYQPDPAKAAVYARKRAKFQKLLEIFAPHWKELADK